MVVEEAKFQTDVRKMFKRMLNQHGIYSRRDMVNAVAITALTITVISLVVWVWYFAVS